jgi:predicted DNA-binding transcriptional regulator AlpA
MSRKSKRKPARLHETLNKKAPRAPVNLSPDLDLMNAAQACQVIGGNGAPINPATLWRGIKAGRYPKPIMVSPNVARWSRAELEAALRRLFEIRAA